MRKLPVSVALTLMIAGCGGKAPGGGGGGPTTAAGAPSEATATAKPAPMELPAPPSEVMSKGKLRLVNLLVDKDGKPRDADVLARRSFEYGPVRLAEKVAFGKASDFFSVPKGMSVVVVPAGADVDSKEEWGGFFDPKDDEHVTAMLSRDSGGAPSTGTPSNVPTKAPAGKSLVILFAEQLMAFEKELQASPLGGYAFNVSDGSGQCLTGPAVLGGTNYIVREVAPGKAKVTLHKWPGDCTTPPVFELEVDAPADKAVGVFFFTRDGKTLEHLTVPME